MLRRTVVLALLLAAVPATMAGADRRPTRAESHAVRTAALRSLHGAGWKVSGIRVSTVRTRNTYARANVEHRRTGVGGTMLLGTRSGRWRRLFLGTDAFCEAPLPRAVLGDLGFACGDDPVVETYAVLTASPSRVRPGAELVLLGSGFLPDTDVVLSAGPPQSEPDRIGTTRTGSDGAFRYSTRLSAQATPGTFVALACQRSCRVKATTTFTIAG